MQLAYFGTSGQSAEQIYVEASGHDFVVLPFAFLRAKPAVWQMWSKTRHVGLVPHVPCCYLRPEYAGDFYDDWKATNAWLVDDDPQFVAGKRVVRPGGEWLLDLRLRQADHNPCVDFGNALADHLLKLHGKVEFSAVFVDCVWDSIGWTAAEGAVWKDRITLDREWKAGTELMLKIVRAGLAGRRVFIIGNGYTTCRSIECRCIEGFPRIGWVKNTLGPYGAAAHGLHYDARPWFIPHSQTNKPGQGASDEDALATIALAGAYYDEDCDGAAAQLNGTGPVLGMNSMQDAKRLLARG